MGHRRRRLSGRQLPAAVVGVERPVPRHDPRLLAWRTVDPGRVRLPLHRQLRSLRSRHPPTDRVDQLRDRARRVPPRRSRGLQREAQRRQRRGRQRRRVTQPLVEPRRRRTDRRRRHHCTPSSSAAQPRDDDAAVARRSDAPRRRRTRPHPGRQQQRLLPGQRDLLVRLGQRRHRLRQVVPAHHLVPTRPPDLPSTPLVPGPTHTRHRGPRVAPPRRRGDERRRLGRRIRPRRRRLHERRNNSDDRFVRTTRSSTTPSSSSSTRAISRSRGRSRARTGAVVGRSTSTPPIPNAACPARSTSDPATCSMCPTVRWWCCVRCERRVTDRTSRCRDPQRIPLSSPTDPPTPSNTCSNRHPDESHRPRLRPRSPLTHATAHLVDAADRPSRVVVEPVRPVVDGGALPAKAALGEPMRVDADVFTDGHDIAVAALRWRTVARRGGRRAPGRRPR